MCPPSNAHDATLVHVWIQDHALKGGVITPEGLENIAKHKYKAGISTHLDNFLNDGWNALTELLPLWLAPNMVTSIGGFFMIFSYLLIWCYTPNWDQDIPSWVLVVSGLCILIYYTLDCMDGKQARRTGASSPLGQLFDHGIDCISCFIQMSTAGAFTLSGGDSGGKGLLAIQAASQYLFYMAQWEEYYTHVLQHANGDYFGVTEVNYGMGMFVLFNAFIDNKAFWGTLLVDLLPQKIVELVPMNISSITILHVGSLSWVLMISLLVLNSIRRVYEHVGGFNKVFMSAISKLISPSLLLMAFAIPEDITAAHTRYVSISMGLLFCLLSIKVIVYSMAKMSYAAVQKKVFPFTLFCLWSRYDQNYTEDGIHIILIILSAWSAFCLLGWAQSAVKQICQRLDIYCFSIKKKTKEE